MPALVSAAAGVTGAAVVAVAVALAAAVVTGLSAALVAGVPGVAPPALVLPSTWLTPAPSPAWAEQQQQQVLQQGPQAELGPSCCSAAAAASLQQALQLCAGVTC
jgi:hypothetical protein